MVLLLSVLNIKQYCACVGLCNPEQITEETPWCFYKWRYYYILYFSLDMFKLCTQKQKQSEQ